jgi:uncharacterized protein YjlB
MSEPIAHLLGPSGSIPNHPTFPLLVYPGAFPPGATPESIRELFASHLWGDSWVNGVFSYHHFHSCAHEVLGCFAGEARVQFGGPGGPEVEIRSGDAVVIPAGVGHRNLGSSRDFAVVGAYPPGEDRDVCSGGEFSEEEARQRIASVPLPPADPIAGTEGPLFSHWLPPEG